jgi:hypothetical protein
MRYLLYCFAVIIIFASCNSGDKFAQRNTNLNTLAEKYVRLGLAIGLYDTDFVDAYYGPDSLKPTTPKAATMPADSFKKAVATLMTEFKTFGEQSSIDDTTKKRIDWITKQLKAFDRRIDIFNGKYDSFDNESADLFSVKAPMYDEAHFQSITAQLNSILPGNGSIPERVQALAKRFVIPKDKIDTVFKTAIAEARKRTMVYFSFPASESFTLEYVTDKPWSGYNWYKGNYKSVIQINTDLPIQIERAIDLGCHEGYPGHHVYNMLLEKNLYRDKGWVEISLYPLYSPQSLIAEGSANYGIEMSFPGMEKNKYCKDVLLPLAGLDTTGIDLYFKVIELKNALNYARNEVARGVLNKTMSEAEQIKWLTDYALMSEESAKKSLRFIEHNRSYVICYNYGQDLVRQYVESRGGTAANPAKRWELFGWILKNPVTATDLGK